MNTDYYVYILTNKNNTVLYTGITNDILRRLDEHRVLSPNSFTSRYNVSKLVYLEGFTDVNEAINREKQLKGGSRADKIALIERDNPAWNDLVEDF